MNTTIEALQNLYTVLGGTASEVAEITTIPDMINAIAGLGAIKASGNLSTDEDGNMNITSSGSITIETTDTSSDGRVVLRKGNSNINVGESGNVAIISNSELLIRSIDIMEIESRSGEVDITTDSDAINIKAANAVNIESEEDIVEIKADNDVEIISTTSGITIDAQGADLTLKGDAVTANGKAVLTED